MADTTAVSVALVEGMLFRGDDGSGHQVEMDAARTPDTTARAAKPVDVLALALGGCTGMDVISMLRNRHQDVTAYEVRVTAPRAHAHPKVFLSLAVEHIVSGNGLEVEKVEQAVRLSATRYCPISAMLSEAVPVVHRYRVLTAEGQEVGHGEIDELAWDVPAAAVSAPSATSNPV